MAPVVGRSPSATFSRDLVTLNRGREEVPADSARCPLTNEGPLERALTLVSRQEPSIRGATTRREREVDDVLPAPPAKGLAQQLWRPLPGAANVNISPRDKAGTGTQLRVKALSPVMRKMANDHTTTVITARTKSSPSALGGQSGLNLTWKSRKAAWRR